MQMYTHTSPHPHICALYEHVKHTAVCMTGQEHSSVMTAQLCTLAHRLCPVLVRESLDWNILLFLQQSIQIMGEKVICINLKPHSLSDLKLHKVKDATQDAPKSSLETRFFF